MSLGFNAHIVASGDIETKRVFIGDASGLTNIPADQLSGTVPSGNLPSDVVFELDLVNASGEIVGQIVSASGELSTRLEASGLTLNTDLVASGLTLDTKINVASGDLQAQINSLSAGSVMSVSGADGGAGFTGDVVVSGLGAQVYGSGAALVIEPDVRRAELVFTSGVNQAILTHNYGERPLVQIYDGSDQIVFACVTHNSVNEVQVDFLEPQIGRLVVVG